MLARQTWRLLQFPTTRELVIANGPSDEVSPPDPDQVAVVAVGTGSDASYHRRFVVRTVGDGLRAHHRRLVTRTGGDMKHHQRFVLRTDGDLSSYLLRFFPCVLMLAPHRCPSEPSSLLIPISNPLPPFSFPSPSARAAVEARAAAAAAWARRRAQQWRHG